MCSIPLIIFFPYHRGNVIFNLHFIKIPKKHKLSAILKVSVDFHLCDFVKEEFSFYFHAKGTAIQRGIST